MNKLVRDKNPLVHCLTNYVTVNDVANAILAVGGSPIMADDIDEVAEIVSIANAVVVNIGTLNERTINSMEKAVVAANLRSIPAILDPVGVGVSTLRNKTVERFLRTVHFTAIRGNLSEMAYCAGKNAKVRGVDASEEDSEHSAIEIAQTVAEKYSCIAIITGKEDFVSDGEHFVIIKNGVPAMKKITGTGCMLSGILGAYLGACEDKFSAVVNAVTSMGIAGEIAFEKYYGTGSLRVGIIDALSRIDDDIISKRGKILL
jgi:hydroxyethylthiazole kinase